jgi:hAT family C-terminal dimerisation region
LCEKIKKLVADTILQANAREASSSGDDIQWSSSIITIEDRSTQVAASSSTASGTTPKRKSLFSYCKPTAQTPKRKRSMLAEDIEEELNMFLKDERTDTHVVFEKRNQFRYLHRLALRFLCVPATSAAVERVFSQSGLLMRPHRSRLTKEMVSRITLVKCNLDLLK